MGNSLFDSLKSPFKIQIMQRSHRVFLKKVYEDFIKQV